jgi:hypothetical protein
MVGSFHSFPKVRFIYSYTKLFRLCQHRWPAIAGMVGFRNNVGSASVINMVTGTSQQIAFERGIVFLLFPQILNSLDWVPSLSQILLVS